MWLNIIEGCKVKQICNKISLIVVRQKNMSQNMWYKYVMKYGLVLGSLMVC